MMTRKQKRASVILSGVGDPRPRAGLVLYALSDTIVFFYTPSEIARPPRAICAPASASVSAGLSRRAAS